MFYSEENNTTLTYLKPDQNAPSIEFDLMLCLKCQFYTL